VWCVCKRGVSSRGLPSVLRGVWGAHLSLSVDHVQFTWAFCSKDALPPFFTPSHSSLPCAPRPPLLPFSTRSSFSVHTPFGAAKTVLLFLYLPLSRRHLCKYRGKKPRGSRCEAPPYWLEALGGKVSEMRRRREQLWTQQLRKHTK